MKLFRLREKAHKLGLVILPHGDKFLVTNHYTKEGYKIESLCDSFEDAENFVNNLFERN